MSHRETPPPPSKGNPVFKAGLARHLAVSCDAGLTGTGLLIRLCVVGAIIGVGLPTYMSQREISLVATAESDLHKAAIAAETFAAVHGTYAGLSSETLQDYGFKPSDGIVVAVELQANSYELTARYVSGTPAEAWRFSGSIFSVVE